MRSTNTGPVDRMAGGAFLQSLDLPAATVAEESRGPSPGMLTSAERAMLFEIVRRTWRGDGVIVDGGSFLGSPLVAEAKGMEPTRRSRPSRWPVSPRASRSTGTSWATTRHRQRGPGAAPDLWRGGVRVGRELRPDARAEHRTPPRPHRPAHW